MSESSFFANVVRNLQNLGILFVASRYKKENFFARIKFFIHVYEQAFKNIMFMFVFISKEIGSDIKLNVSVMNSKSLDLTTN